MCKRASFLDTHRRLLKKDNISENSHRNLEIRLKLLILIEKQKKNMILDTSSYVLFKDKCV